MKGRHQVFTCPRPITRRRPKQFSNTLIVLGWLMLAAGHAETFSTIKTFGILSKVTGFSPESRLVQGQDGTLYGTTWIGEANVAGTLFKVQPDGSAFTVLKLFTNSFEGAQPSGDLTLSGNVLYGTTLNGGSSSNGTVFKINTDGTGYTVLKSFGNFPDGANPSGGLSLSGSALYGTTSRGGSSRNGTVFKLTTDGTGYTLLKDFTNSLDGGPPNGGLTLSGNVVYGTTINGGNFGYGTVFQINTDGTGYAVLKSFTNTTDGAFPGGLTMSGNVLYGTTSGTTSGDGRWTNGTVFKINTDGTGYAVLKSFGNSPDGADPQGALTLSGSVLYGTTYAGGATNARSWNNGTVFKLNTDGTGYTVLKSFTPDERYPVGNLTLSGSVLYGTTSGDGSTSDGTVFTMNTDGTGYTMLKSFTNSLDGSYPIGGLTLSGSVLYGATSGGGSGGHGTIFKLNTDGTGYAVLKNFTPDELYPCGDLTLSGSVLYGTTSGDGFNDGIVFMINTDGTGYTVLKAFAYDTLAYPNGGLVLSGNVLYGTTSGGGLGPGIMFTLTTDGTGYTLVKDFTNSLDGGPPNEGLALSGNVVYGTAINGGNFGYGTVFQINTDGTGYTVLKSFANSADGRSPYAGPTLSGGMLYGTTSGGGFGPGTVFKLDLSAPIALSIQSLGSAVVLSWANSAFTLQAAPVVNGLYTNIPAATSPYTNPIAGGQQFFRLNGN